MSANGREMRTRIARIGSLFNAENYQALSDLLESDSMTY